MITVPTIEMIPSNMAVQTAANAATLEKISIELDWLADESLDAATHATIKATSTNTYHTQDDFRHIESVEEIVDLTNEANHAYVIPLLGFVTRQQIYFLKKSVNTIRIQEVRVRWTTLFRTRETYSFLRLFEFSIECYSSRKYIFKLVILLLSLCRGDRAINTGKKQENWRIWIREQNGP